MDYRLATAADIPAVEKLQQRYHVSTISEEDRPDGFVTTLFTPEQFLALIEDENGLSIVVDGDEVVGYAMAASWDYWSAWPLFQHMIADLPTMEYLGQMLDTKNSYQYGPICVDKKYRSTDVFPNLFEFSRREMNKRFHILITFINSINGRSMRAHEKIELDIIKPFDFNQNHYYALGYDTKKRTPGSTLSP